MFKLRYVKRGEYYIPQYCNKDEEWHDFLAKDIGEKGPMYSITVGIANVSAPRKWDCGQYYFDEEPQIVFFTKEICVMAFLGAAKSYYKQEIKDFEI